MKRHFSLSAVIAFLLWCVFSVGNSFAQSQEYFIEVAVSEQSTQEYNTAVRLGLGAVISRVAGSRAVLNRPEVQDALNDSANFVEQYQYKYLDNPSDALRAEKTPAVSETGNAPFLLLLQYSSDAIADLLNEESQQNKMQANIESSTMFWLVLDSRGRSEIIGADVQPLIQMRVQELAGQLGLNPVFPVLDLQDYQAINVADIRGAFDDRILDASKRYATDAVVAGVITQSDNGIWLTNWRRYAAGGSQTFANNALNLDSVLNGGISWVAQTAKIYAGTEFTGVLNSSSSALVWFSKVSSTDGYARIAKLLAALPGVESVTASYLSAKGMMFSISPRLSSMQLQQNLANVRWLRQTPPPEILDSGPIIPEGAELFFEYAG